MSPSATFSSRSFPDRDALLDALCGELDAVLAQAVDARNRAALAVPGGTTPVGLFERLARRPLPWHSICVTLTDERWVAPDDPASNEAMLRRALAHDRAAAVKILGLRTSDPDPRAAIGPCTERLARLRHPLDAVVLGLGEDGHVASLFPGAVDPAVALDPDSRERYVDVSPPASAVAPGNRRLSMTLAALVHTHRLILLATGTTKQALVARVAAGAPEAVAWPLAAILRQAVRPAEFWWSP